MSYNQGDPSRSDAAKRSVRLMRDRQEAGEENKNRRWLLLGVDILLLVAILAAIFFLVVLLTPLKLFDGREEEQRSVLYTVELAGIERDSVQALEIGQIVTDVETGSVIGEIVDITTRPYEIYTDIPSEESDMTDGEHQIYLVTKNTYPEEYQTVTVTIRVIADYEQGIGYSADDCRIAVGRVYELRFPAYAGTGICVTFAEE